VTDLGDGKHFSASVDYDEPGPFSFMHGPEFVEAREAVAWARRHAPRVVIRVRDVLYSAGEESVPGLSEWPGLSDAPEETQTRGVEKPVPWRAEARTAWFRGDGIEVASRLAHAVGSEPQVGEIASEPTLTGFRVTFTVHAPSIVAAGEKASRALRSAWKATDIEATPGDDYDVPSLTVRPCPGRG
jgi:hypothetical protein